jgi:hypothetical protein
MADDRAIPPRQTDEAVDSLLGRLRPPEPSNGLVNRLHAAGAERPRAARHSPLRPWAIAAAASAAVVAAAYLATDHRGPASSPSLAVATAVERVVVVEDGGAPPVRLGIVHPADTAAPGDEEPDEDGDDEDVALADLAFPERELPFI